jgi:uncharacterized protein YaaN involved in tellurite resistance
MNETGNPPDPAQTAGSGAFGDIDPAEAARLDRTAAEYAETLASLEPGRQKYLRALAAIDRLGQREFTAAAAMSGRMLQRRLDASRDLLAARAPLAERLAELRHVVDELDPARIERAPRKGRGFLGLGARRGGLEDLGRYFDHFDRHQDHIEEILQALAEGRLELERDNALLGDEEVSLATVMATLREHAYLAARLDEALTARIDAIAPADPERAECMRTDLLYAIRRRRQEVLTQLAVAAQGYASLEMVRDGNEGLARAIATATTTTAAALRTAVMVAQSVAGRLMAQEQVKVTEETSASMTDRTDAVLDRQTAANRAGPGGAQVRLATLRRAWDDVFAALDRIDAQKEQALRALPVDREHREAGSAEPDPERGAG